MVGYDERQPEVEDPRIWIQWKGTDLCADVHCECGAMTHVDAQFAYYIQCGACGRVYMPQQSVPLLPLTAEEAERMLAEGGTAVRSG